MTKNYNIAILGDSWAWGEWSWVGDKNFPTHSGTQSNYLHLSIPEQNSKFCSSKVAVTYTQQIIFNMWV